MKPIGRVVAEEATRVQECPRRCSGDEAIPVPGLPRVVAIRGHPHLITARGTSRSSLRLASGSPADCGRR